MKEKELSQLIARLQRALGDRLVSVTLHGSSAEPGEFAEHFSDVNLLCVLSVVTPGEINALESPLHYWRGSKQPPPVILAESELTDYARSFPVEFADLRRQRRVLHGADVIALVEPDLANYRAQVRQELRAALLKLRQKAAAVSLDKQLTARLMADSASTFLVLARHVVALSGAALPESKRAAAEQSAALGVDPAPFLTLLDLRGGKMRGARLDVPELFGRYLRSVEQLVTAADRAASNSETP